MFAGIPKEGIAFLKSLKKNNDRDWFHARKEVFEATLKTPMLELIAEVNQALAEFAPDYVNEPKKALYRIYRDTRFSSDKTPYKTHIAAIFPRRGFEKHASAGYYFQVSPEGVGFAAGAYMPGPEELYAIRTWMTEHHREFIEASRKAKKIIGDLQGDSLKRSPKGFDPNHPAADLVRRKQWFYWIEQGTDVATGKKFLPAIISYFRAAKPLVDFLNQPIRGRRRSIESLL